MNYDDLAREAPAIRTPAVGDGSTVVDERLEPGALDRAAVLARYRTVRGWGTRGPLASINHIHHALAEGIAVDARHGRAQARELRLLAAASEYRESINRRAGVYSLAGRSRASAAFWRTGDLRIAREVRLQVAAAARDHKK